MGVCPPNDMVAEAKEGDWGMKKKTKLPRRKDVLSQEGRSVDNRDAKSLGVKCFNSQTALKIGENCCWSFAGGSCPKFECSPACLLVVFARVLARSRCRRFVIFEKAGLQRKLSRPQRGWRGRRFGALSLLPTILLLLLGPSFRRFREAPISPLPKKNPKIAIPPKIPPTMLPPSPIGSRQAAATVLRRRSRQVKQ